MGAPRTSLDRRRQEVTREEGNVEEKRGETVRQGQSKARRGCGHARTARPAISIVGGRKGVCDSGQTGGMRSDGIVRLKNNPVR